MSQPLRDPKVRGRAVWVASVLVVLVGDALVGWHHAAGAPHGYPFWLETTLGTSFAGLLGGLLVSRRPGHPIGRIALVLGTGSSAQLLGGSVASLAVMTALPRWAAVTAAYGSAIGQSGILAGLTLLLLLVPTGHPLSRRWRPVCWVTLVTALAMSAADLTSPNLGGAAYLHDNPLARGADHTTATVFENVGGVCAVFVAFAGILALTLRFRRSHGDERQQMKWVVTAGIGAVVAILVSGVLVNALHLPDQVGSVVWACAGSAVPAATTAAILRYRLYDIDRVVSRTVSYTVVTGGIVGVYIGAIALADGVLGFTSSIAVATSTLAAAAAFQPLRRRVQSVVDRRFDRAAYDARRTVESFSGRLRDEVDVDAVRHDLLSTVGQAVAPQQVSLWVPS